VGQVQQGNYDEESRWLKLAVCPSIATKGKQRRNEYMKEGWKNGDFEIRDLFDKGMVAGINHGS